MSFSSKSFSDRSVSDFSFCSCRPVSRELLTRLVAISQNRLPTSKAVSAMLIAVEFVYFFILNVLIIKLTDGI